MKMKIYLVPVAIVFMAACSGPERKFEAAINKMHSAYPTCWGAQIENVNWPIRVRPMSPDLSPILAGLHSSGMIDINQIGSGLSAVHEIRLTPKGANAGVWSDDDGFCLGHPQVTEIVRYTYADQGANENSASVEYSWQLSDVPQWVDPALFAGVTGLVAPVLDRVTVSKASDGWRAGH